jgi:hypothetical protein
LRFTRAVGDARTFEINAEELPEPGRRVIAFLEAVVAI